MKHSPSFHYTSFKYCTVSVLNFQNAARKMKTGVSMYRSYRCKTNLLRRWQSYEGDTKSSRHFRRLTDRRASSSRWEFTVASFAQIVCIIQWSDDAARNCVSRDAKLVSDDIYLGFHDNAVFGGITVILAAENLERHQYNSNNNTEIDAASHR